MVKKKKEGKRNVRIGEDLRRTWKDVGERRKEG